MDEPPPIEPRSPTPFGRGPPPPPSPPGPEAAGAGQGALPCGGAGGCAVRCGAGPPGGAARGRLCCRWRLPLYKRRPCAGSVRLGAGVLRLGSARHGTAGGWR